MSDRAIVLTLRQRLNLAWRPFFGRFGGLTETQIATIPHILDGENVTLIAPGRGNIYSSQMRRWRNGYKPFA